MEINFIKYMDLCIENENKKYIYLFYNNNNNIIKHINIYVLC